MKNAILFSALLWCTLASASAAQDPQPAQAQASPTAADAQQPANQTPIDFDKEPHHHLVLENGYVRVFRVEIISPEATLLHHHDHPFIYMSVGATEFVNAVVGKPDVVVTKKDGQLGYSAGDFSHIIRTQHDTPVYNISIVLLHPQGNVSSECPGASKSLLEGCTAPEDAVAAATKKIDEENKSSSPMSSPGAGSNAPITQASTGNNTPLGGDDEKKPKNTTPPSYTPIMESDEAQLRFASFTPKGRTSLPAGAAGTLVVIEPLSQFKLDFADGSSQLLSGGDAFWLQPNTNTTVINTSDQITSSLLVFTFKDAPTAKPNNGN
jgi:hypothetical protein